MDEIEHVRKRDTRAFRVPLDAGSAKNRFDLLGDRPAKFVLLWGIQMDAIHFTGNDDLSGIEEVAAAVYRGLGVMARQFARSLESARKHVSEQ